MPIWIPSEEPKDSLDWSRKFEVFSISRLYLSSLGFSTETLYALTDEDMSRIAEIVTAQHFDHALDEDVRFTTACFIVEKFGGDNE